MSWDHIRLLAKRGIEFGSLGWSHVRLTGLPIAAVVNEAARSRAVLERELGRSMRTMAYPHGDHDAVVRHLIQACGYRSALTNRGGPSHLEDELLQLPRIAVLASDSLAELVGKLEVATA